MYNINITSMMGMKTKDMESFWHGTYHVGATGTFNPNCKLCIDSRENVIILDKDIKHYYEAPPRDLTWENNT